MGGNIGRSFALSVATERRDWYVIELSSFQLDGCYDFRADIGVLTNITPDHLDRYEYRLQNYVDSKFRILRNQRPQDCFIYCADDPLTLENLPKHPLSMRTLPFSVRRGDCAAVLRDGMIRAEAAGRRLEIPVSELRIKGMHNTYDAMAAVLAALDEAAKNHTGVCTLDGSMVDKPMELRARTTLAKAAAAGIKIGGVQA